MFQVSICAWMWQAAVVWDEILQATIAVFIDKIYPIGFPNVLKCPDVPQYEKITSSPPEQWGYENSRRHPPTFVVEEALHLHGRPGVSDTEHGAGYDALLGWRAVCGPHQAPVRLVVESLQNLHSLASAHRQLPTAATITGHKVMDHHCQLTATGQLKWKDRSDVCENILMFICK